MYEVDLFLLCSPTYVPRETAGQARSHLIGLPSSMCEPGDDFVARCMTSKQARASTVAAMRKDKYLCSDYASVRAKAVILL